MKRHTEEANISSSQMTTDKQGELCARWEALAEKRVAEGHDVRRLQLYDGQRLCATVYADFTAKEVAVESVDGLAEAAFGLVGQPSWGAFSAFVEKRCLPCAQPDLQGYLASIGMDDSSPLIVLQKDQERVNRDRQWIKLEVLKVPALMGPGQKG